MSKRIFISCTINESTDGWPMCYNSGCSQTDNQDYAITIKGLKGDEIPDECTDAKTFTQLAAGLLNAYYSGINVANMDSDDIMRMGVSEHELDIPDPELNPTLPF